MEDKKHMCGHNDSESGCGYCGGHMMGKHYHVVRMLLYVAILFFTFWIGLGLGELKGYLRYAPFDGGYNTYPMWMMGQNNWNRSPNIIPNAMMGVPGASSSPIPDSTGGRR